MSEVQDVNEGTNIRNKSGIQDDIQLSAKSFFYTWTLSNFFECLKFSDAKILSPEFEFAGANWRLWLQAVCMNNKLDKIKIRLVKSEKDSSGYYIKYKFSIRNEDGSYASKEGASNFVGESVWGHRLSFKYGKEYNSSSSFVVKGKITVDCDLLVLSSVVKTNDRTSVNHSSNHPKSLQSKKKAVDKGNVCTSSLGINISSGLMRSRNQMPKNVKKPTRPGGIFGNVIGIIFPIFIIYVLTMYACSNESSTKNKLLLNMTEVNELIIDSTLKIKSIAEALNLTDVKIKSSELLAWYRENYPNRNFVSSKEANLLFESSKHAILNDSSSSINVTALVHNTVVFTDDEH